jgi:putative ABC transport system ATP-binding protein
MEPVVRVRDLTKVYGKGETAVTALADASLEVRPAELVAIIGPSGSGKTTLLTGIGCIKEPTSGYIEIDGQVVFDNGWQKVDLLRLRREKIGFILQSFNLIPFLTTLENVLIAMDLVGRRGTEARDKAVALLNYLQVGQRLDNYPENLSGGEKQRVAIARALANDPKVILADEPTAQLDTERGKAVMALLRQLAREKQSAVIVVTHDRRMVEGFDRIYFIEDGRIVHRQDDRDAPEVSTVASLLGNINGGTLSDRKGLLLNNRSQPPQKNAGSVGSLRTTKPVAVLVTVTAIGFLLLFLPCHEGAEREAPNWCRGYRPRFKHLRDVAQRISRRVDHQGTRRGGGARLCRERRQGGDGELQSLSNDPGADRSRGIS